MLHFHSFSNKNNFLFYKNWLFLDLSVKNVFQLHNMAIVFILIICLGIVANLVNVFVFSLNNKKKTLTITFLSHLSFIDMFILAVCLFETLFDVYVVDEEIQIVLKIFCKFFDLLLIHSLLPMRNFIFMKIAIDGNFFTYIFNSLCFNSEFL